MAFFTTSDGVRLTYELEGAGPPLFLHIGAGCDASLWRTAGYLEPLSRSYTCILFEPRGHGASDKPRGAARYHIDRLTADVVELLDLVGLDSVAFFGYSAGISPGVRLAEQHAGRVWALVASGAVGPPLPPDELATLVAKRRPEFREHGWEQQIERLRAHEPDSIPEWYAERMRATDIEQYADLLESHLDWHWDEWHVLPGLDTPTLFLTGELDDEDDDVATIVARMRNAEHLRLPDLGHVGAFLASSMVLPQLEAFLAACTPERR